MEFSRATITEFAALLAQKSCSSRELTDALLAAAEKAQPATNAYLQLLAEGARAQADEADARRAAGESRGPLDGVPLAIKDNMLLKGSRTTAASAMLKNYESPYDATVIRRLRDAGAVLLGKTNMDEFAMGGSNENSAFGPAKNPWDGTLVSGGSSGGSAVAVAAGLATAALGSDTGGSVRQPAAMCGVVGLKPTYGRVSRYGLIAMASSLDQIGPIARSVEDAGVLLNAIEGRDEMDATSVALTAEQRLRADTFAAAGDKPLAGLRVGVPTDLLAAPGLDPEVAATVRAAVDQMKALGATVIDITLPNARHALAVYYVLMPSEVSANMARFDGIRYGERVAGATLEETYRQSRGQGLGREVRRRIMLGTYALSSGYYDAYYNKALKVRRLIVGDYGRAFSQVDVIATPTAPTAAWKIGEKVNDPLAMYLEDVFTVPVNVAGLPAISVPCGFANGLPVGLHLTGRHFDESTLLRAAHAYESAAGWRAKMVPPAAN